MSDKLNFSSEFNKTKDELLAMDEVEVRARFRERCHHTLEIQVYSNAYRNKQLPATQPNTTNRFLEVWHERGLSKDQPEYVYANKINRVS